MIAVIILITAAIAAAGCGRRQADAPAVEVVDSAGVRIVINGADEVALDWRFEPILTLGGADNGPEAFYQIGAGSIGTDAAGNLYVLDRGNHHVHVFDRSGRHLRTMGHRGGGPGELEWPAALIVRPDGAAAVADIGKRALVRFAADGAPLDEQRFGEGFAGGMAQVAYVDGVLVAQVGERDGDVFYYRLVTLDGDRRELLSYQRPPTRPVDLGCVRLSGMPRIFAPSLVWSAGPDFIAAATTAEYMVDIHEGGTRVLSLRRTIEPRPTTLGLALQEVGDDFEVTFPDRGACGVPAERLVEEQGYADVVPAIGRIAVAPDGTLWVHRRGVRGEQTPTDIFVPGGEYIGTLRPGAPFPVAFTPEGHAIVVERDDLDVPRVVVYQVIGLPDAVG